MFIKRTNMDTLLKRFSISIDANKFSEALNCLQELTIDYDFLLQEQLIFNKYKRSRLAKFCKCLSELCGKSSNVPKDAGFYQKCVEFTISVTVGFDLESEHKSYLSKILDLLAISLFKLEEKHYRTMLKCLSVAIKFCVDIKDETTMKHLWKNWFAFKYAASNDGDFADKNILTMSVAEFCLEAGIFGNIDWWDVLRQELNLYKNKNFRFVQWSFYIARKMLQCADSDVRRAYTLTEIAQILFADKSGTCNSAIDCCDEAIQILTKKNNDHEMDIFSLVSLFKAYVWKYICLIQTKVDKTESSPTVLKVPLLSISEFESVFDCSLQMAIEIWEQNFKMAYDNDLADVPNFVKDELLSMCSILARLLLILPKTFDALKIFAWLYVKRKLFIDWFYLASISLSAHLYTLLDTLVNAEPEASSDFESAMVSVCKYTVMCALGRVDKALNEVSVVEERLQSIQKDNNNSNYNRLRSFHQHYSHLFLCLPRDRIPEQFRDENCLVYQIDSSKYAAELMSSAQKYSGVLFTSNDWLFFDCYWYFVQTNAFGISCEQFGLSRHAERYFLEGFECSRQFACSSYWSLFFLKNYLRVRIRSDGVTKPETVTYRNCLLQLLSLKSQYNVKCDRGCSKKSEEKNFVVHKEMVGGKCGEKMETVRNNGFIIEKSAGKSTSGIDDNTFNIEAVRNYSNIIQSTDNVVSLCIHHLNLLFINSNDNVDFDYRFVAVLHKLKELFQGTIKYCYKLFNGNKDVLPRRYLPQELFSYYLDVIERLVQSGEDLTALSIINEEIGPGIIDEYNNLNNFALISYELLMLRLWDSKIKLRLISGTNLHDGTDIVTAKLKNLRIKTGSRTNNATMMESTKMNKNSRSHTVATAGATTKVFNCPKSRNDEIIGEQQQQHYQVIIRKLESDLMNYGHLLYFIWYKLINELVAVHNNSDLNCNVEKIQASRPVRLRMKTSACQQKPIANVSATCSNTIKVVNLVECFGISARTSACLYDRRRNLCSKARVKSFSTLIDLKSSVEKLDREWTIVCLYLSSESNLILIRLSKRHDPFCVNLGPVVKKFDACKQFEEIENDIKMSLKITDDTSLFWSTRSTIDVKIKVCLERLENEWFGIFKVALLGYSEPATDMECADESYAAHEIFQHGEDILTSNEKCELSEKLSLANFAGNSKKVHMSFESRGPVILVLDKNLQTLPLESLPILRSQMVTRMISVHALLDSLSNWTLHRKVNSHNTYFVLNPSRDLPKTQDVFEKLFKKYGWDGVAGKEPPQDEIKRAHESKDLIIYCGHGNGSAFGLGAEKLCAAACSATVLLMGCSSGRYGARKTMYDAIGGSILNYHLMKCPSVLACLWNVTDRDIDCYLDSLLRIWLHLENGEFNKDFLKRQKQRGECHFQQGTSRFPHSPLLPDAVGKARNYCKMTYLTGSSPVIYGLPVTAAIQNTL